MEKTLEQKRAEYSFKKIKEIKDRNNKNFEKKVSTIISKLASLIQTNGLGNTLAFLFAKGKEEHKQVIYILSDWLINNSNLIRDGRKIDINPTNVTDKSEDILNRVVLRPSVQEYMYYTDEALKLINWLRRFSDGMLEKGDENG